MITFDNTTEMDRQPSDVYEYLADLEHTPEWNWANTSSEKITPGPVAIGTQYRQTRSVPRRGVQVIEITGLEPGRRIDVAGTLGPLRARPLVRVRRESDRDAADQQGGVGAAGSAGSVRERSRRPVRAAVGENLLVLKQLLDGTTAGARPDS